MGRGRARAFIGFLSSKCFMPPSFTPCGVTPLDALPPPFPSPFSRGLGMLLFVLTVAVIVIGIVVLNVAAFFSSERSQFRTGMRAAGIRKVRGTKHSLKCQKKRKRASAQSSVRWRLGGILSSASELAR